MQLLHIAIIDDDEDDRILLTDAIQEISGDFIISSYSSGKEFLQEYSNHDCKAPDYIFLDYNMPILSGKEVLSKIKSNAIFKNTVIAIYSTYLSEDEISILEANGADYCLIKPNSFSGLKNTVNKCIQSSSK